MIEFTKQDFRMERFDIEKREYPQRWVDYPTLDRVDEREIESTYLRKFIKKHGDKVTISASAAYKPKDPRLLRFEREMAADTTAGNLDPPQMSSDEDIFPWNELGESDIPPELSHEELFLLLE